MTEPHPRALSRGIRTTATWLAAVHHTRAATARSPTTATPRWRLGDVIPWQTSYCFTYSLYVAIGVPACVVWGAQVTDPITSTMEPRSWAAVLANGVLIYRCVAIASGVHERWSSAAVERPAVPAPVVEAPIGPNSSERASHPG